MSRLAYSIIVFTIFLQNHLLAQSNNKILWTDKNGLSNNSVMCMAKDKQGFLWVGTMNGLNRFDGIDFEVFKHSDDPNSIQSNMVVKLLVTQKGLIVMGFFNGGISIYDPVTKKLINHLPGKTIPEGKINTLYESRSGELLIGIYELGLYKFADDTFTHLLSVDSDPLYNRIDAIGEVNGLLWLATRGGLFSWDKKNNILTPIVNPLDTIKTSYLTMAYDKKDKIWLGSWGGGINSYDIKTKEWRRYLYSKPCEVHCLMNIVSDIQFESENMLLATTYDKGFCRFNTITKEFQVSSSSDIPLVELDLFLDNDNIWIGSTGGLIRIDPLISQINYSKEIKSTSVFYYDSLHRSLIVGTIWGDGLKVVDHRSKKIKTIAVPVPKDDFDRSTVVLAITQRANGDVYVLTKNYLCKLDKTHSKLNPVYSNSQFARMSQDGEGNLWITHDSKSAIFKVDLHDSVTTYPVEFPLTDVTYDSDHNRLWFGGSKGIITCDLSSKKFNVWKNSSAQSPLPNSPVWDLAWIKQTGVVWMAANIGLYKLKLTEEGDLSCEELAKAEGLSSQTILSITSDDSGNLWLMTNSKLGRIDQKDKLTLFSFTTSPTDDLSNYYKLSSTTVDKTQKIFIGDANGAYSFAPAQLQVSAELPEFFIKSSSIPGKILNTTIASVNELNRVKGNNLNILFGSIYFGDRSKIRYAYRIDEIEKEWHFKESKDFYISYQNLPNDRPLTLQIKISNQYNEWAPPVVLKIEIPSPLWQRSWFIVTSVLLLFAIVWFIASYFVMKAKRKVEAEMELKRKIYNSEIKALRSQMNPHFIFNCLNSVQDQILNGDSREATRYIGDFGLLLRKILNNSDSSFISLKEEIATIELYLSLEALRFKDQFVWKIKTNTNVDIDSIEIPPMLIQPILENAIHHGLLEKTGERILTIDFFIHAERLICRIEDNGIGIDRSMMHKAFLKNGIRKSKGTALISDRLAILNHAYALNASLDTLDLNTLDPEQTGTRVDLSFEVSKLELA